MPSKCLLLLATAACCVAQLSSAADNVTVFRCCGPGEMLDLADVHGRCVPLPPGEPKDFVPVIYDPYKEQFLEPNGPPPSHWNTVAARPPCRTAAAFLSASPAGHASRYVQFLNGSLWAQIGSSSLVDPGLFCLDRGGALVCQSDEQNKTKKCCGPSAMYSEQKGACEFFSGRQDADGLPVDVASGFPWCDDDAFVMSGHVNVSHWPVAVDGNWAAGGGGLRTADGVTLEPREYCLEHVVEEPKSQAWTVFTCAGRHERESVIKSYREDIRFTLYPLGLLLSVFFLAVTLVASCMLPSTYHVLHWKCQVNHVGCLLVGDLCLAFVQLSGDSLRGSLCVFTGIYT